MFLSAENHCFDERKVESFSPLVWGKIACPSLGNLKCVFFLALVLTFDNRDSTRLK
jgi:hypothetical protein